MDEKAREANVSIMDIGTRRIKLNRIGRTDFTIECFMHCEYDVWDKSTKQEGRVECWLIVGNDPHRPYGLKSVMRNKDNKIIDIQKISSKFSTLCECAAKMEMLASAEILPCTIQYVL